MKKFLIIIFLTFSILLFSQENENKFYKYARINFGGGINFSFYTENFYVPGTCFNFLTPFSFTAYLNKTFGLGFNFNLGINLVISKYIIYPSIPKLDNINWSFSIINTFFSKDNKYLYLEYGLLMNLAINQYYTNIGYNINDDLSLFIGHTIFLGYNKIYNFGFSYIIGGNISGGYTFNTSYDNISGGNEFTTTHRFLTPQYPRFYAGIEIRFLYSHEIKSNKNKKEEL